MFADQSFSHQMIISLILTTFSLDYVLTLLGENRLWSLLRLKGLRGYVAKKLNGFLSFEFFLFLNGINLIYLHQRFPELRC